MTPQPMPTDKMPVNKMPANNTCVSLVIGLLLAWGGCGNDDDQRETKWGFISPLIIQPNCATSSCHSKTAAAVGLDLSTTPDGYKSLLMANLAKRNSQPEKPRRLLIPFNPDESHLLHMLRANGTSRMPPDRPLPEADVRLIERWILGGALND